MDGLWWSKLKEKINDNVNINKVSNKISFLCPLPLSLPLSLPLFLCFIQCTYTILSLQELASVDSLPMTFYAAYDIVRPFNITIAV